MKRVMAEFKPMRADVAPVRTDVLVGSEEFFNRLKEDVRSARENVYVQAMSFEADGAGLSICHELRGSPATDIRVLVDEYVRVIVSDSFVFAPTRLFDRAHRREVRETRELFEQLNAEGIKVRTTNPLGFLLTRLLARNHKKLVVVDDRVAYVGGINFSDHNFEWHDMMLRIEAPDIAAYLRDDFLSTWSGVDQKSLRSFPGFVFHQLDGRGNEKSYESIFNLLDEARDSIVIESPYLSFPFYRKLREAVERGVEVRLILPEKSNKGVMQRYNLWEARRSGIDLRLLKGRMTHLKAVLIDEEKLIVGSSNFDFVSYRCLQELVVVVHDPETIARFDERVFRPDWQASVPVEGTPASTTGPLCYLYLKAIDILLVGVSTVAT
ncbi:MAG: phosphatidylserine/phosphatidylglycerophosphate/cardiolipin synthase family protein [Actinobacteria bacterium]|nr:phosphatidylserine/phosphatidylglycerophosphate/cardiolipin synthase family protein [Actinomycetota bacterium]